MLIGMMPIAAITAFADELSEQAYTLTNGYITLEVSKKNGGFSVRTADGDILKKSDNNKKLLYHDGEYDTSFVSFRVDDGNSAKDYVFGGKYKASSEVSVSQLTPNSEIVARQIIGSLEFVLTYSLVGDKSNEHGMTALKLDVINNGSSECKVKARVLLDTSLGERDFGYYEVTAGGGASAQRITRETVLDSTSFKIPQNFYATDDPYDPSVTAYSVNATLPYSVAFAHWNSLAASLFDFTPIETLDFTREDNEYLTADSAYAMYYDLGSVTAGGNTSAMTYYGVYSHHDVPSSNSVAVDLTAPVRLELNGDKSDYVRLTDVGIADFEIAVNFTNIDTEGAIKLENIALAVTGGANIRPLTDLGGAAAGYDFENTEPFVVPYSELEVGDTKSKTLYFEARTCELAAYEKLTVGVYDVSATEGKISENSKLGERSVYILLPGNDGNIPKVSFTSMTPKLIYSQGTRHLFVAVTNPALLEARANYNMVAHTVDGKNEVTIPHDSITVKDGVMDIALGNDLELVSAAGSYYLSLEWTDAAVSGGIVEADGKSVTSPELYFTVTDDIKYKNDTYGLLTVVETARNKYEILSFADENEYLKYVNAGNFEEILLTFRGEFTREKTVSPGSETIGTYYSANSSKTLDTSTREYTVDNRIVINDCIDFEGGKVAIYYEDYGNYNSYADSPICVEFDGELYTAVERSSIWKGKAIFTKIEQGEAYSLIPYDSDGERDENFSDNVISLVWNSAAGIGQTLAGMIFKLAYGELGSIEIEVEETKSDGSKVTHTKNAGVIAFSASLDLSFAGKQDQNDEPSGKVTYWSKLQDLWQYWREDMSLYDYAYNSGRIDRLLDMSEIDESDDEDDEKRGITASVMVKDVLFGAGEGFVGVNFTVGVGIKNYISALPEIEGEISVNTINDWSFGVEGKIELTAFTVEAEISFKSHNNIPVPDNLYVFVGNLRPGINIDGLGVVWLTGAGGGISNIYDTIFLTQAVPPLRLLLSVSFNIIQILECEKATLSLGLTGISLEAEGLNVLGIRELTMIENMSLGLEWYPGIDLKASIVVDMFDSLIYGAGYIVLISPDYHDVFFEMFARARLNVPKSIPVVGGMTLAGIDLGISTEKVWGSIKVLFVTLGVAYYWGEGSVDFGSGSKAEPSFPELLGYDDIPVYYDAEKDQTLYAKIGTNTRITAANNRANELVLMSAGASVKSNIERNAHELNFGTYDPMGAALAELTFDIEGESESELLSNAESKASAIKLGTSKGLDDFGLIRFNGENYDSANANLTVNTETKKATFAFSVTDSAKYGKTYYLETPAGTDVVLYGVESTPSLDSITAAISGSDVHFELSGEKIGELDKVSLYLTETTDPDNTDAGYAVAIIDNPYDLKMGYADFKLPGDIPSGNYYVCAVYSKDNVTNGRVFSTSPITVVNANTPGNAVIKGFAPAGDYTYSLEISDGGNTDGYLVNIFDKDGKATDFAGIKLDISNDGRYVVGGSYEFEGEKRGLSSGEYYVEVTPYKLADNAAVYGKAQRSNTVLLPEAVSPTLTLAPKNTPVMRTSRGYRPLEDGSVAECDIFTDVFTSSDVGFTLTADEKINGTAQLDDGTPIELSNALFDSTDIDFAGLSEGEHTLKLRIYAADGDSAALDYTFCVDTLAPKLLVASPISGSFTAADGSFEFTGVCDAGAKLTVNINGETVAAGIDIAALGAYEPTSGVFSAAFTINNYNSKSEHEISVVASDDVGNTTTYEAVLSHGGLAKLDNVELAVDGVVYELGTLPIPSSGLDAELSLIGVTEDNNRFVISGNNASFALYTAEGDAEISGANLKVAANTKGMLTGRLQVADGAWLTNTLVLGVGGTGSDLTVATSSEVGGSVSGGDVYEIGDTVVLTAVPDEGYEFAGWTLEGVTAEIDKAEITFTMPANNVTAKASFRYVQSGTTKYDPDSLFAKRGEKVRVRLPIGKTGAEFLPYYIDENTGNIIVPNSDVIDGYVTFIAPVSTTYYFSKNPVSFNDVKAHWADEYINFVAEREIMRGVAEKKFAPDSNMTRAMFVTVLWRLAGSPAGEGSLGFEDVNDGAWYTDALVWGVKNNIVNGYDEKHFGPDDNVTREQLCVLIARYLKNSDYDINATEDITFADADKISVWAKNEVNWCAERALVSGRPGGMFAPRDNATRAENAAVIRRMIAKILIDYEK